MNPSSYISTTVLPIKMLSKPELIRSIEQHKIPPYHVKVNPTNKCPGDCSFCTFKNRDKSVEIDYDRLLSITDELINRGAKAFTLTGGGDPMAYPRVYDYIDALVVAYGVKVGMVTEGLLFKNARVESLKRMTWCRVSLSDERKIEDVDLSVVGKALLVDWSLSYLVLDKYDIKNIAATIEVANHWGMTHVRMVDNIIDKSSTRVDEVKNHLKFGYPNLDTSRVVYQPTEQFTKGRSRCLVSLLKPGISPYGHLVPCCSVSVATDPPLLDWRGGGFHMGSDVADVYDHQKYFDGSVCDRCYQSDHNDVLELLWNNKDIDHQDFI